MKKLLLIIFIATILDAKILEVKQLFNFKTISVKKVSFEEKKSFYAKTAIDESKIYDVSLRFDAFINDLFVDKVYKFINKGDPLFNIYSKEVSSLHEEFIISKTFSNSARKNAILKLNLLGVKPLIKESKPIYNFNFLSPFSGYVIEKNIFKGSFIKSGKTIMKIADFSKLWVIAKVYQKDISFITKKMRVKVTIDGFSSVDGEVDFIYPNVDVKDQTISVRIIIDNSQLEYFPNLFAKVSFSKKSVSMLQLPKSAVLKKADKYFVFVLVGEDGEFEPKEISAKRVSSNSYQILSGLKEGEKVIDRVLFMLDSDAITNSLYDSEDDEDW